MCKLTPPVTFIFSPLFWPAVRLFSDGLAGFFSGWRLLGCTLVYRINRRSWPTAGPTTMLGHCFFFGCAALSILTRSSARLFVQRLACEHERCASPPVVLFQISSVFPLLFFFSSGFVPPFRFSPFFLLLLSAFSIFPCSFSSLKLPYRLCVRNFPSLAHSFGPAGAQLAFQRTLLQPLF